MQNQGISIVIPTVRTDAQVRKNLESVARALTVFEGFKELVLMADRRIHAEDFLRDFASQYQFVRLHESEKKGGSANARLSALRKAKYDVILFTDDDCVVPLDWVQRMYESVVQHGIVTGNLSALDPDNIPSQVDAYVDQLRMQSIDERGETKYISFPNCGIHRTLLPEEPFSPSVLNTVEDIDLGCRLRLQGVSIHYDGSLVVQTEYPTSLSSLLKRKAKHAKGIAHLRAMLSYENRQHLGLAESPWGMLARWAGLSLQSNLSLLQKMYMLLSSSMYCTALAYYDRAFQHLNNEHQSRTP